MKRIDTYNPEMVKKILEAAAALPDTTAPSDREEFMKWLNEEVPPEPQTADNSGTGR